MPDCLQVWLLGLKHLAKCRYSLGHVSNTSRSTAFLTLFRYVVYSFMIVLGASILIKDTGASSSKLFIRGAEEAKPKGQSASQSESDTSSDTGSVAEDMAGDMVAKSSKVSSFTFKDVSYTVQVNGEDRRLLVCQRNLPLSKLTRRRTTSAVYSDQAD